MKNIKFLIIGILFGIILSKTEVVSWYRIYEMFKFQSFHMYGIIGSAVVIGIILMQLFKKGVIKDYLGNEVIVQEKEKGFIKTILGGTIFGLGWALTGACPGPMYTLVGAGFPVYLIVIGGALIGTFLYGLIRGKLPH